MTDHLKLGGKNCLFHVTGKCCVNLVSTFMVWGFVCVFMGFVLWVFFGKAKEQSKTESSGFVFNLKTFHFYSSTLKMLCLEKRFNDCRGFLASWSHPSASANAEPHSVSSLP